MYQEPIINFKYFLNWLYASFFCFVVNGQKKIYKPSNIEFDYHRYNETHDCPTVRIFCDIVETEKINTIDFDGVKSYRYYKEYPNSCKDYKEFDDAFELIGSMDAIVSKFIRRVPHARGYKLILDIPYKNIEPQWWIDIGANDAE